ncbi:unnamed protein product [Symbiodinium natans]|uniref:DUF1254 domain-containing protein n=1 Tax=Symbiodinium natans TaxID=878477 RepID=A0A812J884_9DINO|nr:unnamed protein product [Symbiodinium natans]
MGHKPLSRFISSPRNYNTLYAYGIDEKNSNYKAPFNRIHNEARVFTPEDKVIVTPNSDTPYSFCCLDLRAEPVLITVPAMEKDRYFSFQMVDMYTHNFDYLGTRCTGNSGGVYMITGPGWTGGSYSGGGVPAKVDKVMACETPFALAIVRTQLKNPEDIDKVKAIQAGYKVDTLSAYLGKPPPESKQLQWPMSDKEVTQSVKMYEILDFVLSLLPVHDARMAGASSTRSRRAWPRESSPALTSLAPVRGRQAGHLRQLP